MGQCCDNYKRVMWGSNGSKVASAILSVLMITGIIMVAASGDKQTCMEHCFESSCTSSGTHYECRCSSGGSTWCEDKEFPKGSAGYYGLMLIGIAAVGFLIQCFAACCCPPKAHPQQVMVVYHANAPVGMQPMYAAQGAPQQAQQNFYPQQQQQSLPYAQGGYNYPQQQYSGSPAGLSQDGTVVAATGVKSM